jgi:hypothetical protein
MRFSVGSDQLIFSRFTLCEKKPSGQLASKKCANSGVRLLEIPVLVERRKKDAERKRIKIQFGQWKKKRKKILHLGGFDHKNAERGKKQ